MSAVQRSSAPEAGVSPVDIRAAQPRGGPTVLRMLLGIQLRRLREAANLTPDQAGYEIRASRSKISRVEHGRVGFKERDVSDLLSLYGVTDPRERDRMLSLARQANNQGWWAKYDDIMPDWFESYVGLEQATSLIRTFELQFVPGLFQTEDYARGVTMLGHRSAPSDEIEHRVSLRMQRQKILHLDDSPRIWAVIDESALRRPLGGVAAMKVQLRHLIEVTQYPRVTLQVMPFSRGGHPAAGGSFTVLRFAEPDLPDIVYLEQLTSALYLDRRDEVDHYMEVMNRLSAEADTPADSARLLEQIAKSL
ncbi:MAG TPA: helix-turn-helix transcriptional regulator [Streptosporangiaceae bacterium]|nr:helix-turn-helix transcriptional regulator [Streptosporangiaceae bacterium]